MGNGWDRLQCGDERQSDQLLCVALSSYIVDRGANGERVRLPVVAAIARLIELRGYSRPTAEVRYLGFGLEGQAIGPMADEELAAAEQVTGESRAQAICTWLCQALRSTSTIAFEVGKCSPGLGDDVARMVLQFHLSREGVLGDADTVLAGQGVVALCRVLGLEVSAELEELGFRLTKHGEQWRVARMPLDATYAIFERIIQCSVSWECYGLLERLITTLPPSELEYIAGRAVLSSIGALAGSYSASALVLA